MNKYQVQYYARNEGAIGVSSSYTVNVVASDTEAAKELAREQAYAKKLEHVHIAGCWPIPV
jgi:hypothetical protein